MGGKGESDIIERGTGESDIIERGKGESDMAEIEKGRGDADEIVGSMSLNNAHYLPPEIVGWEIVSAGFVRTARCLFRGEVFVE